MLRLFEGIFIELDNFRPNFEILKKIEKSEKRKKPGKITKIVRKRKFTKDS